MSDHEEQKEIDENKEMFLADILAGKSDFIRTNDEIESLNPWDFAELQQIEVAEFAKNSE